ncbi:hypothetical protein [Zoogloea sp.]|uniref:hypothetical protein n=1 Tax=Zoogloea sp. TaxID=49181 RepID=UPI001416174C|nr:MAG: hypothetical protein F9K15_01930 [Zoogloea sp.]
MKKCIMTIVLLCQGSAFAAGEETFDVLAGVMDRSKKELNARRETEKGKEDFLKSKYGRYYKEGYWQFFQGKSQAAKGEFCTAMFSRENMLVSIMGPGGSYRGALMMLASLDETSTFPRSTGKLKVTLKQGSDAPATLHALSQQMGDIPVITFAVPTIEAAMAGMEDTLNFHLEHEGKTLGDIEWHSGFKARDELRKCLAGKPFYDKNPLKDKAVK